MIQLNYRLEPPEQLPGKKIWLDIPNSNISDGSFLPDRFGNGFDFSQGTASKQPIYNANGDNLSKASLTFDGVNDFLDNATSITLGQFTVFMVFADTNTVYESFELMLSHVSNAGFSIQNVNQNVSTENPLYRIQGFESGPSSLLNGSDIDSTTSTDISSNTPYNATSSSGPTYSNTGSLRIGCRNDFETFHSHFELGELILYDRGLSAEEMQYIHSYLGSKWGISS